MQTDSVGIPLPEEQMPDWLLPLRNSFLASLVSLGLKLTTIKGYAPAVDWLCAEAGRRGLTAPEDVGKAMVEQIRDPLPTRLSEWSRQKWTHVLNRFAAFLVKEGAIAAAPQPPTPAQPGLEALWTDYVTWLRTRRGLAPGTVKLHQLGCRGFLAFRFGDVAPGELNAITRDDIVAWFGTVDETGHAVAKLKASSLRSLLRFLFATGRTDRNLALCVPSIGRPRSPAPIQHLPPASPA